MIALGDAATGIMTIRRRPPRVSQRLRSLGRSRSSPRPDPRPLGQRAVRDRPAQ
ncbi:MAG: hypothetical protein M0C28_17610 [Candidatus Moduliflexus flocculans]|nr:hypothetical protein [Candidatus Moduliflexus flocculans]